MAKRFDQLPDAYAASIGRVADKWAQLEYQLDTFIWAFADVEHQLGSCMTAQMISIHPKMKALIALVELRGASENTIKQLKSYYGDVLSGLSDKRNRFLHDPRCVDVADGLIYRLEATTKPSSFLGFRPELQSRVEDILQSMTDALNKLVSLMADVVTEVNGLPEESRPPLIRIMRGPAPLPTPTNDTQ